MSDDIDAAPTPIPEGFTDWGWRRGFGGVCGPLYGKELPDFKRQMGFRVEQHHTNGMKAAHGGMLMTFADVAWGNTVSVERSSFWVTIKLTCEFLSSARLGEWVEGGGEVLNIVDDVFTVAGKVWVGDRLILTGSGVFKALTPREPRPGERAYETA
ncbi:MAG: PaaI family thioesterase [Alphaproteobacteria bacterium]|nr:PaaI family thioesterase [Alphaproteobacteria bacterium]